IQKYRLALAIKPHMWRAWGNIVSSLMYSDSEEAAARESDAMLKAAAEDSYNTADHLEFQNSWIIARDFPALIRAFMSNAEQNHGVGTAVSLAGPSLADAYDNLHDFSSARKWLAKSDPDDDVTKAQNLLQQVYEGLESGQAAQALEPARRFWDLWLATEVLQNDAFSDQACMVGLVYGLNGDLASAEEVFRKNRPWSYCYAAHGDVLEHAGQLAAAEKVWADGLRAAPRMSPVYLHRGIAELKRGDYRRAEADLAAASERSPHWADPLKAWGDLLARQGRWKEALAKYQAALAYAPNWPALRAARDAAQSKGG
ncbi:MAG: tetratricopeptide repeat protein, partial [Paucibacter sp.]|nr:tetratricopeptide repeat protein [Roseateles sp.]